MLQSTNYLSRGLRSEFGSNHFAVLHDEFIDTQAKCFSPELVVRSALPKLESCLCCLHPSSPCPCHLPGCVPHEHLPTGLPSTPTTQLPSCMHGKHRRACCSSQSRGQRPKLVQPCRLHPPNSLVFQLYARAEARALGMFTCSEGAQPQPLALNSAVRPQCERPQLRTPLRYPCSSRCATQAPPAWRIV